MTDHLARDGSTDAPDTLVVGAGGFLGRAVSRALTDSGARVLAARVPWDDPDAAVDALVDAVRAVRTPDRTWRILWCAGTGVVATGAAVFEAEQALVTRVLDTVRDDEAATGTVFFASSAGAVYAGGAEPPFDEHSAPAPLAPYGRAKLAEETLFGDWSRATGARLAIGRISNLYGPGANLGKPQGLVSQLALAHLEGRTSSIYVPMTTTRDYLYIDDAAAMVLELLDAVEQAPSGSIVTKVLASGRSATIADVIGAVEAAFDAELDVEHGVDPSATFQGLDLRMRTRVLTAIDDRAFVPFAEGVDRTVRALRAQHDGPDVPPGRPAPSGQ